MTTIWKFPLTNEPHQRVRLPGGEHARPLWIDRQNATLQLWAVVTPDSQDAVEYDIWIVGTGTPLPNPDAQHLNTIQVVGFVFHFFAAQHG